MVWKTYLVGPPKKTGTTSVGTATFGPSGVGVWSTPTVDVARGVLYITTGDNYSHPATSNSDAVIALALKTGRIAWSQQTTPNDVYNSSCGRQGANCPDEHGPDFDEDRKNKRAFPQKPAWQRAAGGIHHPPLHHPLEP